LKPPKRAEGRAPSRPNQNWTARRPSLHLRDLLGRLFRAFFADFFFNLAAPFAGEPRTKKTVKQIREKQNRRHPFIVHRGENEDDENDKKSRNRFLRFPIDRL